MKKICAITLTMILILCNCMVAFGATTDKTDKNLNTTDNKESTQDVTATYDKSASTMYCVDIYWGKMQYKYSGATTTWNTETHSYEIGDGGNWELPDDATDGVDNVIRVVNHSNANIYAKFSFTPASGLDLLTGFFFKEGNIVGTPGTFDAYNNVLLLATAENTTRDDEHLDTIDTSPKGKVKFKPGNKPNKVFSDGETIGTLKVEILTSM